MARQLIQCKKWNNYFPSFSSNDWEFGDEECAVDWVLSVAKFLKEFQTFDKCGTGLYKRIASDAFRRFVEAEQFAAEPRFVSILLCRSLLSEFSVSSWLRSKAAGAKFPLLRLSSKHCCNATGVNHSRGKHRSKNGIEFETAASRFTHAGISFPVSVLAKAAVKWLQFFCN